MPITDPSVYNYIMKKFFPNLEITGTPAQGQWEMEPPTSEPSYPNLGPPMAPVGNQIPTAPSPPVVPQQPQESGMDMEMLGAQLGEQFSQAGRMMSTTPGAIMTKFQPAPAAEYTKGVIQRRQLQQQEQEEARAKETYAEKRKQALFEEEIRKEQRSKWAIAENERKQAADPISQTSQARRASIEAIYPSIRGLLPKFDSMSAQEIEQSIPSTILRTIQDAEESRLRIAAETERRALLHEEKQALITERTERRETIEESKLRARGVVSPKVAEEFRNVDMVNRRIGNIEKLYKEFNQDTGPVVGRIRGFFRKVGTESDTAELRAELGKAFADYVKSISGAAVSEAEFQRLANNMPQPKDDFDAFSKLLNSWKLEQQNKLEALGESEANREGSNEYLVNNLKNMISSVSPMKTLAQVQGRWVVTDKGSDVDRLNQNEQRELDSAIQVQQIREQVEPNQGGYVEVVMVYNGRDNQVAQMVRHFNQQDLTKLLKDAQAMGYKVTPKGNTIIIDAWDRSQLR